MKKRILFILTIIFCFIGIVNAEGKTWIEYDWSLKQGPSSNWLYYDYTIEDTDGYITTSVNENVRGVLRKVSKDGKEIIWEQAEDSAVFLNIGQDDNYYYTAAYVTAYEFAGEFYLCRHSKETGEMEDCLFLDDSDKEIYYAEIYTHEDKIYVTGMGKIAEGEYGVSRFYTIDSKTDTFELENAQDYSEVPTNKLEELTYYRDQAIADKWYELYPDKTEKITISNQFISGNAYYIVGDATKDGQTRGFLMKADLDKNILWVKKSEVGYHYFDASSPSTSYVAVVAYKDEAQIGAQRNPENVESYIYVYDSEGNVVETHDIAIEIGVKRADITSLTYCGDAILVQAYAYDDNDQFSSYLVRYLPNYAIYKKITGQGTVDVIEKSHSGESVTYTITPEKGYVLEKVTITDVYGNVIETTKNVFTMPSADVIIEVTFLPENPNTAEIPLLMISISLIAGTILLMILSKKMLWLR